MQGFEFQQDVPGWVLDEAVAPAARLRQGDLIRFGQQDDLLREAGIVVTADCDLEQKKHARLVTLVPVVTAKTILEHYLILEDCERKRPIIEEYAFREYSIDSRQDRETKLSLLATHSNADVHESAMLASSLVLDRCNALTIASYKKLMHAIKSGPKKATALKDQIRGRGDLLILPDTRKLGIVGGIAWIRHVWQVPLSEIALRTSEAKTRAGERVARLDSPYRYRLTQLMAQVFSDIGLPNIPDEIDQFVEDAFRDA